MTEQRGIDRRQFLRSGALAGLSVGLLPWSASAAAETPGIQRQVRLGRTDLRVSDIGFGSSRLKGDEALVHHALERGITYFDTAAGYTGGRSEETLGRALQGRRDGVSLVSKVKTTPTSRRDDLMQALEGSLRRLRTDRLDVYFSHAVNDVARLQNAEWPEFLGRAREQGKIRFAGLSGHGGRLVECLDFALDHDLVDVVLVAYNFGQDPAFYERLTGRFDFVARQPDLPRVLARARQQDVGVVAMKTLMGAKLNDLGPYQTWVHRAGRPQARRTWACSGSTWRAVDTSSAAMDARPVPTPVPTSSPSQTYCAAACISRTTQTPSSPRTPTPGSTRVPPPASTAPREPAWPPAPTGSPSAT
jgi:hypothetical protein